MKPFTKAALIGGLAYCTWPIWAPLLAIGRTAHKAGTKIIAYSWKRPVAFTLGLAIAGTAVYGACNSRNEMQELTDYIVARAIEQPYRKKAALLEEDRDALRTDREWLLVQAERQHEHIGNLERKLEETVAAYNERIEEYRAYAAAIEERAHPDPSVDSCSEEQPEQDRFYYLGLHETLGRVTQRFCGAGHPYEELAQRNCISDPQNIPAGTLLRIPPACSGPGTYETPPALQHIVLPGTENISAVFDNWEQVIAFNKTLGLDYSDEFPHKEGERIVYYEQ